MDHQGKVDAAIHAGGQSHFLSLDDGGVRWRGGREGVAAARGWRSVSKVKKGSATRGGGGGWDGTRRVDGLDV